MSIITVSCNFSTNAAISGSSTESSERNSTITGDDPVGAVRFTIAVVLVYGVGVIGLLGITARRNRRTQMMDKEVNHFIRTKLANFDDKRRRKKKDKSTVFKLISSFHNLSGTNHQSKTQSLTHAKYLRVSQSPNINTTEIETSHGNVKKLLSPKGGDNVFLSLSVTAIPETPEARSKKTSIENLRETDSDCDQSSDGPKKKRYTETRTGHNSCFTMHQLQSCEDNCKENSMFEKCNPAHSSAV